MSSPHSHECPSGKGNPAPAEQHELPAPSPDATSAESASPLASVSSTRRNFIRWGSVAAGSILGYGLYHDGREFAGWNDPAALRSFEEKLQTLPAASIKVITEQLEQTASLTVLKIKVGDETRLALSSARDLELVKRMKFVNSHDPKLVPELYGVGSAFVMKQGDMVCFVSNDKALKRPADRFGLFASDPALGLSAATTPLYSFMAGSVEDIPVLEVHDSISSTELHGKKIRILAQGDELYAIEGQIVHAPETTKFHRGNALFVKLNPEDLRAIGIARREDAHKLGGIMGAPAVTEDGKVVSVVYAVGGTLNEYYFAPDSGDMYLILVGPENLRSIVNEMR